MRGVAPFKRVLDATDLPSVRPVIRETVSSGAPMHPWKEAEMRLHWSFRRARAVAADQTMQPSATFLRTLPQFQPNARFFPARQSELTHDERRARLKPAKLAKLAPKDAYNPLAVHNGGFALGDVADTVLYTLDECTQRTCRLLCRAARDTVDRGPVGAHIARGRAVASEIGAEKVQCVLASVATMPNATLEKVMHHPLFGFAARRFAHGQLTLREYTVEMDMLQCLQVLIDAHNVSGLTRRLVAMQARSCIAQSDWSVMRRCSIRAEEFGLPNIKIKQFADSILASVMGDAAYIY